MRTEIEVPKCPQQRGTIVCVRVEMLPLCLCPQAGELYEKVRMLQQALQAYRAGKDFRRGGMRPTSLSPVICP